MKTTSMRARSPFRPLLALTACLLALGALLSAARPALAYEDLMYNFSVQGPDKWLIVKEAAVPGLFRYGWLSDKFARDKSGACVSVFVQLLEKTYSAREVLDANVRDIKENPRRKATFKILRQEVIKVGNRQGFILEVLAPGVGGGVKEGGKIPTRQRWYAVVRDQQMIVLLSTCAEKSYSTYAPVWAKVEKSLDVR